MMANKKEPRDRPRWASAIFAAVLILLLLFVGAAIAIRLDAFPWAAFG
jgi:hypothetical protein